MHKCTALEYIGLQYRIQRHLLQRSSFNVNYTLRTHEETVKKKARMLPGGRILARKRL